MEDMTMTSDVFGNNEKTVAAQAEAFRKAVRNPVERSVLVASDALQACLQAIGRLVPDTGWTPPVEPAASRS